MSTPVSADCRADKDSWRVRLREKFFHDYNAAAFRLWLAIVCAGGLALGWALVTLSRIPVVDLVQIFYGLLLVAVAAWFPVEIPRSKYSISVADAFIFTILTVLGTPAAILAAGCDGLVGSWRSSSRITSRISTPAAAMAAMAVCGFAFSALSVRFVTLGMGVAVAKLLALVVIALVPFVLTTLPLMATVTLKRGAWPDLREWFSGVSWVAGMYLAAGLVAGMVQLSADRHGPAAIGIVAVAALAVILLLRISIARNEAEHKAQETRLVEALQDAELNQRRFAAAFADAAIGMAIVEPAGSIVRINTALCTLLGRSESDLIGRTILDVLHPNDVELFERQAREVALRKETANYTIELRCRAGHEGELWVALHCGRFSDSSTGVEGLIYQLLDITSRQVAEARLQHIAYHDALTDLANRACFNEGLLAAVDASRVDPDKHFAVMFLDVDRFKIVNDSLGHFAGNELLREVARRLQMSMRPHDLVARLGGDEFAVLLRDPGNVEEALQIVQRVLDVMAAPVFIRGNEIVPSISVGITFSDLGYRTVDELLRDADLAMYEAKAAGRGRMSVFDRSMHERIADKLALEADLRRAIGEGELSLAFQPLFDLNPQRLIGFEALARWDHPMRGPVSPTVFIGLAEEAGHIEALTAWAIEKAVAQLAAWHRAAPHMAHAGMSVNISGRDLANPQFVHRVLDVLRRHGVAPRLLTLEITESVLMAELDVAKAALAHLRSAGVLLAIDDFGTGYSSLAYLSTLPIDSLKIDRSFVIAMGARAENVEIVRAVLTLGRALSKKVVAEGIETQEQLDTLRELGVHVGQGYLLGRPLRPDQIPQLLAIPAAESV